MLRGVQTESLDVFHNLALEEALLAQVTDRAGFLFFWRSDRAVVCGKNQNPWNECAPGALAAAGIPLARRISGGGAVYHDVGNLNYTLLLPRARYRAEACLDLTCRALGALGIAAQIENRTSLVVDGKKVSGHAFCLRPHAALHHGTLLVRSELPALRDALRPAPGEIVSRAVASIPLPVANLTDFRADLTGDRLQQALTDVFFAEWKGDSAGRAEDWADPPARAAAEERLRSWTWIYGETPDFDIAWRTGDDPPVRWRCRVEDGKVRQLIGVDAETERRRADLTPAVAGLPFGGPEMRAALAAAAPYGAANELLPADM